VEVPPANAIPGERERLGRIDGLGGGVVADVRRVRLDHRRRRASDTVWIVELEITLNIYVPSGQELLNNSGGEAGGEKICSCARDFASGSHGRVGKGECDGRRGPIGGERG